jgi:sterol desaturase/sphingolipid hydroxylase (fatty acid hydroxylase superfamily)
MAAVDPRDAALPSLAPRHAAEPEAVDTNFAVHLPVLDLLFGTAHLPDRWPSAYGLAHAARAPRGYLRQLLWPLRRE